MYCNAVCVSNQLGLEPFLEGLILFFFLSFFFSGFFVCERVFVCV